MFTGYYCESGVDRPNPQTSNATQTDPTCSCSDQAEFRGIGGICPLGHFCPGGSYSPNPCEAGSYGDEIGLELCKLCPQGFYCLINATDFLTTPCPTGIQLWFMFSFKYVNQFDTILYF